MGEKVTQGGCGEVPPPRVLQQQHYTTSNLKIINEFSPMQAVGLGRFGGAIAPPPGCCLWPSADAFVFRRGVLLDRRCSSSEAPRQPADAPRPSSGPQRLRRRRRGVPPAARGRRGAPPPARAPRAPHTPRFPCRKNTHLMVPRSTTGLGK